ncbi:hypothetical protein [Marinifilum sp. D714]|uniref:hypothetical protein n=1 Tax=Marinifilum sp. D714 TaxID=2937523 RepID=UPI0027C8B8FB|nr:hypothetical protein [Marinifilum sp. D714]MDQ2179245.1 hypothetical protein [Marinifilum sp. D714]
MLILILSVQSTGNIIIILHYKFNQDFFAEICENKDKPEMECNGKCHLKKQLKQQEENESEKKKINIEKENLNFISSCFDLIPEPKISDAITDENLLHFQLIKKHVSDIFHPPQNISFLF